MTYKQAMNQKCKCGKFCIGGWYGEKKNGRPIFAKVSAPQVFYPGTLMWEEHTLDDCYAPQRIT